ncbi:RNA polymerase sigma-70 factor (family 1) [Catalinimonas alkaloidigena]|uniref:RNA polymerase sigma-70 factor n=1 Tax=Catalinimonas alkaloidigena TaxID=1075417 RepID=UPI0024071372|nr:RNA polymerase sigma-70 factor [Catalinimonas alkaloidigena]MDF9798734.1 RNA polymerase sigma-70 factor (family 1) [Catalinimonas alkaloidigena]
MCDLLIWEQIQSDSEVAFGEFFNQQWQRCFSIAYKILQDQKVSEDLVQDVFIDLWSRRKSLDLQNPEAYLTQMVKNKVFTTLSRNHIPERNIDILETLLHQASAEDQYILNELREKIEQVVEELPPRCKQVYVLRRYEDRSVTEIAERLGMSVRTVENHLYHATKILKNKINPVTILLILKHFI